MNAPPTDAACRMFCRGCGYALIGLPSHRCPECGREFDPADPRTFLAHPRRHHLRRIGKIIALLLVCLALCMACYVGYLDWQVRRESQARQILRAYGAYVPTYDTTPSWMRVILRGHAAWLWERAEMVDTDLVKSQDLPQCLAAATNLKSLRKIDLFGFDNQITDDNVAQLKGFSTLPGLELRGAKVTDLGLAQLKNFPGLQYLGLGWTHVTDAGMAQLDGLTALQALDLGNTQVTDAALAHLQGFTALQYLDVQSTRVSDAALAQIKNLKTLQWLNLDNTNVTDAGLAQLKNLTALQQLYLGETAITDAGLAHLKNLPALQRLYLGETQVTDAGLEQLKGLKALRMLSLGGTQVTDAGVADLQKALPACQIDVLYLSKTRPCFWWK